jgi:predicted glycosyltransferase
VLSDAGLQFVSVGGDHGKGPLVKIMGVIVRTIRLFFLVRRPNILCSASHGSRAHTGAARLAGIPSLTSYDYEHSSKFLVHTVATKVIIPELISHEHLKKQGISLRNIVRYHGFKEQVYLDQFFTTDKYSAARTSLASAPLTRTR